MLIALIMALRYLFIDFDSFYASVEQQRQPQLRGRPVGVVPSIGVDTTSCIAASYEAKALGVKTGTAVREAQSVGGVPREPPDVADGSTLGCGAAADARCARVFLVAARHGEARREDNG